jgi:hypothetical protein
MTDEDDKNRLRETVLSELERRKKRAREVDDQLADEADEVEDDEEALPPR